MFGATTVQRLLTFVGLLALFTVTTIVGMQWSGNRPGWPTGLLSVPEERLDFGVAWVSNAFEWALPITNTSRARDVDVLNFEVSCQCTSVSPSRLRIRAGETRDIRLTVDLTRLRSWQDGSADRTVQLSVRPILGDSPLPLPPWTVRGRVRELFEGIEQVIHVNEDLVYGSNPELRSTVPVLSLYQLSRLSVSCARIFRASQGPTYWTKQHRIHDGTRAWPRP